MPLTWSRAITRRVSPLCTAMVLMVVVGLVVCCGASSLLSTIVRDSFSRGTSLFSVVSIGSCPSTILVTLLFRGKTESFELSEWIDSTIVPNRSYGSFFFFTRYFNRTKCKVTREKTPRDWIWRWSNGKIVPRYVSTCFVLRVFRIFTYRWLTIVNRRYWIDRKIRRF